MAEQVIPSGTTDAWPQASGSSRINVGRNERAASAVVGGLLALLGLSRFSVRGLLLAATGGVLLYRGASGHCPVFEALGHSTADADDVPQPAEVHTTLTVNKPRDEVYRFWRDVENLPRFMTHLEQVVRIDDTRSHWAARIPKDLGTLGWDAEVTEDEPGRRLAWRSLAGADVDNTGVVSFEDAPGGGTEVHVAIAYRPPAGAVGTAASRLLTPVFEQMVKEDVRRFKHLLEAGELPTTEGQPSGAS